MSLLGCLLRTGGAGRLTVAPTSIQCSRSYMKNFYEKGTAQNPRAGWMHKDRAPLKHRFNYRVRIEYPVPSEVKRFRKDSLNHRMSSEGGRRLLQQRILNGDNVIAEPF